MYQTIKDQWKKSGNRGKNLPTRLLAAGLTFAQSHAHMNPRATIEKT